MQAKKEFYGWKVRYGVVGGLLDRAGCLHARCQSHYETATLAQMAAATEITYAKAIRDRAPELDLAQAKCSYRFALSEYNKGRPSFTSFHDYLGHAEAEVKAFTASLHVRLASSNWPRGNSTPGEGAPTLTV